MPSKVSSPRELPTAEFDSIDQFARRSGLGRRTVARAVADRIIPSIKFGGRRLIEPAKGLSAIRGELPPPEPPRRGRPRKRA